MRCILFFAAYYEIIYEFGDITFMKDECISLSKEELRECFQKIFSKPEAFALISTLGNGIMTLQKSCDQNDPRIVSLTQYAIVCLGKILAALPDDLAQEATEGLDSVGFKFETASSGTIN